MHICFLGFGEAAYYLAEGLSGQGIRDIQAFDVMASDPQHGEIIRKRAESTGTVLCATEEQAVKDAEIVIAAVPAQYTLDLCKKVSGYLQPGQLYVDVSASTPNTKQKIWAILKDTGVLFADAAMLGALGVLKQKVPILACGNGAELFYEKMTPYGMKITCIEGKAGDASAIKLMRSIYTKGIAAVMIEMLEAASVYGVEEAVMASLSKSLDNVPFESLVNRYVEGAVIHAERRSVELCGSLQMLKEAHVKAGITEAAIKKYAAIASSGCFAGASLESQLTLKEILQKLNKWEQE